MLAFSSVRLVPASALLAAGILTSSGSLPAAQRLGLPGLDTRADEGNFLSSLVEEVFPRPDGVELAPGRRPRKSADL
jgi:hypothetical protein